MYIWICQTKPAHICVCMNTSNKTYTYMCVYEYIKQDLHIYVYVWISQMKPTHICVCMNISNETYIYMCMYENIKWNLHRHVYVCIYQTRPTQIWYICIKRDRTNMQEIGLFCRSFFKRDLQKRPTYMKRDSHIGYVCIKRDLHMWRETYIRHLKKRPTK